MEKTSVKGLRKLCISSILEQKLEFFLTKHRHHYNLAFFYSVTVMNSLFLNLFLLASSYESLVG